MTKTTSEADREGKIRELKAMIAAHDKIVDGLLDEIRVLEGRDPFLCSVCKENPVEIIKILGPDPDDPEKGMSEWLCRACHGEKYGTLCG